MIFVSCFMMMCTFVWPSGENCLFIGLCDLDNLFLLFFSFLHGGQFILIVRECTTFPNLACCLCFYQIEVKVGWQQKNSQEKLLTNTCIKSPKSLFSSSKGKWLFVILTLLNNIFILLFHYHLPFFMQLHKSILLEFFLNKQLH